LWHRGGRESAVSHPSSFSRWGEPRVRAPLKKHRRAQKPVGGVVVVVGPRAISASSSLAFVRSFSLSETRGCL
jgi:hypothetical protein